MSVDPAKTVVAEATRVINGITHCEQHSVSSSVLAADGRVFSGVNISHFTGGPCAELVALGTAAAAGAENLTHIVAVASRGRGIISPCGRCRQILVDFYPQIKVVVAGMRVIGIRDLMPHAYVWADVVAMEGAPAPEVKE